MKLSDKIVGSWMGDPMISDCQAHGSLDLIFFLYTEFNNMFLKIPVPLVFVFP